MQSVEDIRRSQVEVAPEDDLSPYSGKWVALREGRVIASAGSLEKLLAQPTVKPGDVTVSVTPSDVASYVL